VRAGPRAACAGRGVAHPPAAEQRAHRDRRAGCAQAAEQRAHRPPSSAPRNPAGWAGQAMIGCGRMSRSSHARRRLGGRGRGSRGQTAGW